MIELSQYRMIIGGFQPAGRQSKYCNTALNSHKKLDPKTQMTVTLLLISLCLNIFQTDGIPVPQKQYYSYKNSNHKYNQNVNPQSVCLDSGSPTSFPCSASCDEIYHVTKTFHPSKSIQLSKSIQVSKYTQTLKSILTSKSKSNHKYTQLLNELLTKQSNSLSSYCPDIITNWLLSNRHRNKIIKSYNGNRRKAVSVIHWNMGSSFWKHKLVEIKSIISEKNPDILIISEANIFKNDNDYELHIPDYHIILPNTMELVGNCRLALLVKEGINVQILEQFMEPHVSSVWLKISEKGHRKNTPGRHLSGAPVDKTARAPHH